MAAPPSIAAQRQPHFPREGTTEKTARSEPILSSRSLRVLRVNHFDRRFRGLTN